MLKQLPNLLTCANLICGFVGIAFILETPINELKESSTLGWVPLMLIALASVFDFLDGFVARKLNAFSNIGKDLDSLADNITFGLFPAALGYKLLCVFSSFPSISLLLYAAPLVVASSLRLARFNSDPNPTSYFKGLPTPANGIFWAFFFVFILNFNQESTVLSWLVIIAIWLFSFLMVSPFPIHSLKGSGGNAFEKLQPLIGTLAAIVLSPFIGIGLAGTLAIPFHVLVSLLWPPKG